MRMGVLQHTYKPLKRFRYECFSAHTDMSASAPWEKGTGEMHDGMEWQVMGGEGFSIVWFKLPIQQCLTYSPISMHPSPHLFHASFTPTLPCILHPNSFTSVHLPPPYEASERIGCSYS